MSNVKPVVALVIVWIMLPGDSPAAGERPMSIGLRKLLFVDDHIVASTENVTLEVGQARKHGVVMRPTLPTDLKGATVKLRFTLRNAKLYAFGFR
ncbi:MAG: hypothetical protein ACYSU0_22955 [Planctomycetota bacterium]|jgi:hypothetical protein